MFGVPSIEERSDEVMRSIEHFETIRTKKYEEFETLQNELESIQAAINRLTSRHGELKLLKDIRDGELTVVHTHDGSPARIAIL